MDLTQVCW